MFKNIVNKATGLYGIPRKLLKLAASILSPSLSQIFNKSLSEGIYPHDWKMAKVLPIFKNGKNSQLSNYRRISIILSVAKVFGRLVYNQFYFYLHYNSLLSHDTNKGRFRSKPISAFVDNFALHQSQRFNFEIINKKSKKISSHSKASVSNNFHVLGLKPKGYIQAQIYLKFYRGTFLNSAQNGNYRCLN